MNTSQQVILGFLGGLTAGVITGLLLAPEKGQDTRQIIADKAKEFSKDLVENQLQPSIDKAKGAIESITSYANGLIGQAQEEVENKKEELKSKANEVKSKAKAKVA